MMPVILIFLFADFFAEILKNTLPVRVHLLIIAELKLVREVLRRMMDA